MEALRLLDRRVASADFWNPAGEFALQELPL